MDIVRGRFGDIIDGPHGHALWAFLNHPETIIRMETATSLGRAAVEPLGPFLLQAFPKVAQQDRFKQATGFLIRQVLEARGFPVYRPCRITRSGLFTSGMRYVAKEHSGAADDPVSSPNPHSRFEIQPGDIEFITVGSVETIIHEVPE